MNNNTQLEIQNIFNKIKNLDIKIDLSDYTYLKNEIKERYLYFIAIKTYTNDIDNNLFYNIPSLFINLWESHVLYIKNYLEMCNEIKYLLFYDPDTINQQTTIYKTIPSQQYDFVIFYNTHIGQLNYKGNGQLTLTVNGSNSCKININSDDTIQKLIEIISLNNFFSVKSILVKYNSIFLHSSRTIQSYNINNDSIVNVFLKMIGC